MRKIKDAVLKTDILVCLFINIVAFISSMITFGFRYETYDDVAMMINAYKGSPYVVYQNIIIGYLYKFLYSVFGYINWYSLIFYTLAFVSSNIIVYVILKRISNRKIAILVGLIFTFTFSADLYTQMQFTKLAGMIATAGFASIYNCKMNKNGKISGYITGVILVVVASLIRYNVVMSGLPFIVLLCILMYSDILKVEQKKSYLIGGLSVIICFAVALGCAKALNVIGKQIVNCNEEYVQYAQYNKSRSVAMDHRFISFKYIEDNAKKISFSENDYKMLSSQDIADPDYFDSEKLVSLANIVPYKNNNIYGDLAMTISELMHNPQYMTFWGCVLLVLLVLMFYRSKKEVLYLLLVAGFVVALTLYLMLVESRVKYRVQYTAWVWAFVALALSMTNIKKELTITKYNILSIIIMSSLCCTWAYNGRFLTYLYPSSKDEILYIDQYVEENKDNLYFISTASPYRRPNQSFNSFDKHMYIEENNLLFLGSHLYPHPATMKTWEGLGVKNPYKQLFELDNTYLIGEEADAERIKTYIAEHYCDSLTMEEIDSIGETNKVFKFRNN